jgi:hypothetical protein
MSKYCKKCGAKLDEGSVFCSKCGEKVPIQKISNNKIEEVVEKGSGNTSRRTSKNVKVLLILLLVFSCIFVIFIAATQLNIIDTGNNPYAGPYKEYFNISITGKNTRNSNGEIMYYLYYYDQEDDSYYSPAGNALWIDWYQTWPPYTYISAQESWDFEKEAKTGISKYSHAGYTKYKLKIEWYEKDDFWPTDTSSEVFLNPNYDDVIFNLQVDRNNKVTITKI